MPAQLSRLSLRYKQRQMFGRFVRFRFQGSIPEAQQWQKTWSGVASDTDERSKKAEITALIVRRMASWAQVLHQ
jgi:hypothetical protein